MEGVGTVLRESLEVLQKFEFAFQQSALSRNTLGILSPYHHFFRSSITPTTLAPTVRGRLRAVARVRRIRGANDVFAQGPKGVELL